MNIKVNTHSSIQIDDIAFDPYGITDTNFKAKYIFLTHTHYDHLDVNSIKNISNNQTIIVATYDAKEILEKSLNNKIIYIKPNEKLDFDTFKIETFASYNINKNFHKKEYNWVGYKLTKDNTTYAVLGDTDATPELDNLTNLDFLFVPIGGTYTMNAIEAANLTNKLKPATVIPVHYGSIVGTKNDEDVFITHLNKNINYKILL